MSTARSIAEVLFLPRVRVSTNSSGGVSGSFEVETDRADDPLRYSSHCVCMIFYSELVFAIRSYAAIGHVRTIRPDAATLRRSGTPGPDGIRASAESCPPVPAARVERSPAPLGLVARFDEFAFFQYELSFVKPRVWCGQPRRLS